MISHIKIAKNMFLFNVEVSKQVEIDRMIS
jgi:hypothetical protein